MDQDQDKNITVSVNRNKIINIVLAAIVVLLVVYGWQLKGIKDSLTGDNTVKTAQDEPADQKADTAQAADDSNAAQVITGLVAPNDSDYYKGNKEAKLTLIEYSDYDCPFCSRFHATAAQAFSEYDGRINWVFRQYPLEQLHPDAPAKAQGALCVGELGGDTAFWKYTDALLNTGAAYTAAQLGNLASEVGVNKAAFQACLDSGKYENTVDQSLSEGYAAGVEGTPGSFVYNNETGKAVFIHGAQPLSVVKQAIETAAK